MITPEKAARIYADAFTQAIWEAFLDSKDSQKRRLFRLALEAAYKAGVEHVTKE